LLKCGLCGYAYTAYTQISHSKYEGPVEYPYYTCGRTSPSSVHGTDQPCTNTPLMGAGVEKVVWTTVRDLLLDSDALARKIADWLHQATADSKNGELQKLTTARLKELRRQRERLIDAYQSGALDLADFQPRKEALENRILAVEHEQAELRSRESRRDLAIRHATGAQAVAVQLCDRLRNPDFKLKRAILRLVVDKVIVIHHRLEIHLALPVSGSFDLTLDWGARPTRKQNICEPVNKPRGSCAGTACFLPIDRLSNQGQPALRIQRGPSEDRFGSVALSGFRRGKTRLEHQLPKRQRNLEGSAFPRRAFFFLSE